MTINVNHESKTIANTSSLDQLLEHLKISKQGIAVAINNQIISKNNWKQTHLNQNDEVTIIQATQGG